MSSRFFLRFGRSLALAGGWLASSQPAWSDEPNAPPLVQGSVTGDAATSRATGDAATGRATREPATPPPSTGATTPPPAWKVGLAHYSVGDSDKALETLRPRLLECEMNDSACDNDERATLFASLAIVQAGGTGQHAAAVQSFRRALAYRGDLVLLPQYQTPPIVAAFEEAKSGTPAQPSGSPMARSGAVPLASVGDEDEDEDEDEESSAPPPQRGNLFLLTTGDVEYLQLEAGNRDLFGNDTDRDLLELSEGQTLLRAGMDVTAGLMPSDTSGFTFGMRLRGGGIWGNEATPYGSMEAVVGSTMGPRRDHTFFYLLGSFGASYYTRGEVGAFSAGFRGGASFKRFAFAASFSTLVNENFAGLGIGLQLGLGHLFDFDSN